MRPLDRLSSIKTKLGTVIVAAVAVTVLVVSLATRAGLPLILSGGAAGLIALGMVQFLARGMTFPLREMAGAAEAMAKGDYNKRVTATSQDEVGALARAFNAMAADLAEVDRMRKDLVANVSHELRTPISALQAVLENVLDGVEPLEEQSIRTMLNQVERLGRLVAQLLDLSRLESGAVPLSRQSFRIADVIHQAVEESRLHAQSVELKTKVDPRTLDAEGDPERVHQVLANLLENAVRHSPEGGTVTVSAAATDHRVVIEVTDEGPGIPASETSRVFERFYRTDTSRSSSEGGTGLGLAIAKWIVDLHGGHIQAEPNFPNGCKMVVELPLSH